MADLAAFDRTSNAPAQGRLAPLRRAATTRLPYAVIFAINAGLAAGFCAMVVSLYL